MIDGVRAGVVLLGPADRGPFRLLATWPLRLRQFTHLTKTGASLAERRGLVSSSELSDGQSQDSHSAIGYPIEVRGSLHGAAVLEVAPRSGVELQGLMRQLHWGAAWLELLFSREAVTTEKATRERIQAALRWLRLFGQNLSVHQ